MYNVDSAIQEAIKKLELRITVNSLALNTETIGLKKRKLYPKYNEQLHTIEQSNARRVIDECCEAIEKLHFLRSNFHKIKKETMIKILGKYSEITLEEIKATVNT